MRQSSNKRFYGYCRESIDLESGIQIQREKIETYTNAHGYELVKLFIDNNKSAFKNRPEFDKLWGKLDEVDGLVVADMTRFGRNYSELLLKLEELKTRGKTLICIRENIDSSNKESEFMLHLLSLFAQRERDITYERMVAGIKYAKIHGTKSGKPMNRPQIPIDWKMFDELHGKGISMADCARLLGINKNTLYNRVMLRKEGK